MKKQIIEIIGNLKSEELTLEKATTQILAVFQKYPDKSLDLTDSHISSEIMASINEALDESRHRWAKRLVTLNAAFVRYKVSKEVRNMILKQSAPHRTSKKYLQKIAYSKNCYSLFAKNKNASGNQVVVLNDNNCVKTSDDHFEPPPFNC